MSIADQCACRINILNNELNKVIQKRHYSLRKKTSMQESKIQLNLNSRDYKKRLKSLEQQYNNGIAAMKIESPEEYTSKIVSCLLESSELLHMLRRVAQSGGKELNYFSKNWRNCFPHYKY